MRFLLALLSALLLATGSLAATPTDWVQCGTENTANAGSTVNAGGGRICYLFDEALATGTYVGFTVRTASASCNLVQDTATTGGAVVLELRACPTGLATKDANTCGKVLKTFSADDAINITRGSYAIVATTGVTAGEDAIFSCIDYVD